MGCVRIEIRPQTAVALLFAVLLVTVGGSIAGSEIGESDRSAAQIQTERLADDSEIWPYTSRGKSTSGRTLALNIVVYGDADTTERYLRERSTGDWEELEELEADEEDGSVEEDAAGARNKSTIAWGQATGANRYVYVDPPNGDPRWIGETYQLKDGTYLGDRHHIRAYADPEAGNWTAMQAHREHWDWFQVRHTVHSISESQSYVENEFLDSWYVDELSRQHVGNDKGADADGWVTVVTMRGSSVPALLGLVLIGSIGWGSWRRQYQLRAWWNDDSVQTTVRSLIVVSSIVALYTAIRVLGVEAEQYFTETEPKTIVAVLYPILVTGLPIVAYLSSRHLDATHAFTAAALGFVVAMFLDYGNMGVSTLPLNIFVHRVTLAAALGFIAAGASESARAPTYERGHVRTGVLLWVVAVGVPLLRFL